MNNNQTNPGAMVLECKTCKGTGSVPDGEIDCFADGTPFENGPVLCVSECPDCAGQPPAVGGELEELLLGEMNRRFELGKQDEHWLCVDDTQLGVEFAAEFVKGHVAPLLAENKRLELMVAQSDYNYDSDRSNWNRERDELKARIAELEAGQGKPVAWVDPSVLEFLAVRNTTDRTEWRLNMATHKLEESYVALYGQAQPATAQVVLPERIEFPVGGRDAGWNACLDEVAKLNGGQNATAKVDELAEFNTAVISLFGFPHTQLCLLNGNDLWKVWQARAKLNQP